MSTVIGWAIFYADSSVVDSCMMAWKDAPADGVVEIVLYKSDDTRRTMGGHDWYWRCKNPYGQGVIYGHESNTTLNEIVRRYPGAEVKRGMWIPDELVKPFTKRALDYRMNTDGGIIPAD